MIMPQLPPLTTLGHISTEEFIRDYWQQRPLLIRQAIPNYTSPLCPNELAGLALEEDIESRIILEHGAHPWELRSGPFSEDALSSLPATDWTLLVQAADHYLPEVSQLLDLFRFIPSWRLDDIMISYAVKGGSVGPHFDQYDVFLLQAGGKRHWQIGQTCSAHSRTRSDTPLHILEEFIESESFTLEPGDMLYLPPKVAHWGKALDDDCITYSIGFRAPSQSEILEELLQEKLATLTQDDRFTDPAFTPQLSAGEISDDAIAQIQSLWRNALTRDTIEQWLGRHMTQPKYEQSLAPNDDDIDNQALAELSWDDDTEFARALSSRFAYRPNPNNHQLALMFIDGEQYTSSLSLAKLLANNSLFNGAQFNATLAGNSDIKFIKTLLFHQKIDYL